MRDVSEAGVDAVGYCGSDKWEEADSTALSNLNARPVVGLDTLRFSLACRPEKQRDTLAKLNAGEPLLLGTSYPKTLRRVLGSTVLPPLVRAGAIEGLPWRFPALDGVFEMVKSGDSLRANNLVTVVDELEKVVLMEICQKGITT